MIGGEFVQICATEGCLECPEEATDLTGWEIEDNATNDGSPGTSIIFVAGELQPGECITIYSGYLNDNIPGNPVGTEGSIFNIGSDRSTCFVWNNTSDGIFLYDGDSQGIGTLIDAESYSGDGTKAYEVPTIIGCPIPEPLVYIASSHSGIGTVDQCGVGGEFVKLCATEGCTSCTEKPVDLAGWEIEDRVTNDGSPSTTVNITAGSLKPGECVIIYSGYLNDNDIPGNPTGTEGSSFIIASDRDACPVWNNIGGDDIFLYNGDSQNGATLLDMETYGSNISTEVIYDIPTLTGCPPPCSSALTSISAPEVGIVNSACTVFGGTPEGGSFSAPTESCPTGTVLQYSTNNVDWGTILPTYNQTTAMTVYTRCNCTGDNTVSSIVSSVPSVPGSCPLCPTDLSTQSAPKVGIENSACTVFGGSPKGGSFSAPTGSCPTGTVLQYSTNNVDWGTILPTYNQTTAMTVYTRCNCTGDNIVSSDVSTVTSLPGPCPQIAPLMAEDLSIIDPCDCLDPLNRRLPAGYLFHDILTVTTTPDVSVTISATDDNLKTIDGLSIPVGTTIPQTAPGSGIYQLDFYTLSGVPATITVNNLASTQDFITASCNLNDCEGQATDIPTMSEWGLLIFGLLILNMSLLFLYRQEELMI